MQDVPILDYRAVTTEILGEEQLPRRFRVIPQTVHLGSDEDNIFIRYARDI